MKECKEVSVTACELERAISSAEKRIAKMLKEGTI